MKTNGINSNQNNPQFSALKKIRCQKLYDRYISCNFYECRVISELKDLASRHDFFKKNNVNAMVTVERYYGTNVELKYKPVAKTLADSIKNFFKSYKRFVMKDTHSCPDDSSFLVSKRLRNMTNEKDFFTV